MLVLTRRGQERIQIGDQITVTVVKIKGNTVRLGIEAPRHISVVRGELPPKAEADRAASAGTSTASADRCLYEVSDGPPSEPRGGSAGDATGEPSRLQDLVAKVRQASAIAHAI